MVDFNATLSTVKTVISGNLKRRPKIDFQDRLSLWSILQYFCPSLGYQLPLRPYPFITERLLNGRKESNQTDKQKSRTEELE